MQEDVIREQIQRILLQGVEKPVSELQAEKLEFQFAPKTRIRSQPVPYTNTDLEDPGSEAFLDDFCTKLFDATRTIDDHVDRLDKIYAELFTFHVHLQPDHTIIAVTDAAIRFLERFPAQPLGLPGLSELPEECFDEEPNSGNVPERDDTRSSHLTARSVTWPCLKVTTRFSTNVLRIVLFRDIYRQAGTTGLEEKQLVDLTAELLHKCSLREGSLTSIDSTTSNRWLLVRCFLWSSWQRAQMLYFYRKLFFRLNQSTQADLDSLTMLRSYLVAPDLSIQQFSDLVAFEGKSPYMCSWAFNLLRTDAIAVGSDFRRLHMRFNQLLGHLRGRCNRDSAESCDGSQLGDCVRSQLDVKDQSMHDHACPGKCPTLIWDEDSYRSVDGGRAVAAPYSDVTDYDNRLLKYTAASENTLAISHAWAHGQGGRPSTGLNQCLHIRYVQLAHKHGCDSYFLDTACIPEAHALRKEAIMNINQTFRESKMTLIVDKDLLTVDISEMNKDASELSVELQECLLAAVLVSDWNVRAWTLLEATKGRRNIHLLCKNALSKSYREIVQAVASRGKVDLAIFALLAPHLLAWTADSSHPEDRIELPAPTLEEAGTQLSYRPASRAGDDLVIWSLMINQYVLSTKDAEQFWESQQGKRVATGFLISSAGRVGKKGLTWAPDAPYAAPKDASMPQLGSCDRKAARRFFRAFTGEESEYADIDERGIFAEWCVFEFDGGLRARLSSKLKSIGFRKSDEKADVIKELDHIRRRHLGSYKYGALIQPKSSRRSEPWAMHKHIAEYSGGVKGTLVVILGSNKSDSILYQHRRPHTLHDWEWRQVYEWPAHIDLPEFEQKVLWIA